jgi:tetratricopeptide (TPR) repeat protein
MPENFWRDEVIQPALNNDVDDAVAEQRAILAKDPNNAKAYFALGTLSHFRGEIEQAIEYYRKSIELNPADTAAHLSLGRIHAVRREYAEAWKHARAAEALGANDLVEMLERYPVTGKGDDGRWSIISR